MAGHHRRYRTAGTSWYGIAMGYVFMLVAGMALAIKWVVGIAEARGRNQTLWGLAAATLYLLAYVPSGYLIGWLAGNRDDQVGLMMLAVILPFVLAALAVFGLGVLVRRLDVKIAVDRHWDVHCNDNGPGRLEISPDSIHLEWQRGRQEIPRTALHTIEVDGECLRLGWTSGELLLMPMMRPQTRDGRIRQSQLLARSLRAGLPRAVRVDRKVSGR